MPTPILNTKLYVPPPRPEVVFRPRLVELLNENLQRRLTLVSAPAGFGKTTLLGEWAAGCGRPVAWLSLDEEDSDPTRFLVYLVAALQTVAANIGEGVSGALQSPQPPPAESLLTALLNEVSSVEEDFVLVLDDYHVIDAGAVDDALTFLIEHLPPNMHLVVATREDPRLPLARLRARGQLAELRAADLRFTPSEAAEFLGGVMGLSLSEKDISALEARTEGWIAGLQLAALSMRSRADTAGFIESFTGSHRFVLDYLVEEVLQHQPERVQSFLMQTSILDRLSGPLCDALTGQEGGSRTLQALERSNLFVVPLDDRRRWYRYHHLFADVLQARMMEKRPDQAPALHRRASEWYEQEGLPEEAIRHALAAGDFGRAAALVERAVPAMRQSRQEITLLGWLRALPDELFHTRPVLSVGYAGALLLGGEIEGAHARLRDAERWLDTAANPARPEPPSAEMVVVDEEEFRRLPASIAVYRAASALARGDVPDTVKYALRALDLMAEDDHLGRGAAAGLLGLAYWASGDLESARRTYAGGMAHLQAAGNVSDAIGCAIALAVIRIAQGRLREAMRTYERGLQLAKEQGDPTMRGTADMHVGMSELYRERNDLDAATQHLLRSKEQGERAGLPQNPYRSRVATARIREAQGDLDGALELLHEAERLYVSDYHPNVRPISALKARMWIRQGRLGEALDWTRERGLSPNDDLSYLREFEHITLARVLITRYESGLTERSIHEALGLLDRLLEAAEEGERTGSVIEVLVLQALAHQARGDISMALAPLERALKLAEPEGYVRTFIDEGAPMARLLSEAAARGIAPDYTGKLLAAFEAEARRNGGELPLPASPASQPPIESLSRRELEVLRLLGTELSGPEIANELVVALSTVRTHTKSIYRKLGVKSRRAAVRRAAELGLI